MSMSCLLKLPDARAGFRVCIATYSDELYAMNSPGCVPFAPRRSGDCAAQFTDVAFLIQFRVSVAGVPLVQSVLRSILKDEDLEKVFIFSMNPGTRDSIAKSPGSSVPLLLCR